MKISKPSRQTRNAKGFTLIELMIVVAIIGILASIAYPSYVDSVRKSRRADAKAALVELAQFMERNYTLSNRYDQTSAGGAVTLPYTQTPKDGTAYYNLAISASDQQSFTLSATPTTNGGQSSDTCGTLTITSTGEKSPATQNCW